ncbi:MerR family transcriptional regulator [Seohaeicola zhoushanensis]
MTKSPDAFRTISEVADWLGVPAHVLRFWESKFTQVKPVKRAGGRRYYRPADMLLLGGIKALLHNEGMTIKGVQKMLREQGIGSVSSKSQPLDSEIDVTIEATAEPEVVDTAITETRVVPFKTRDAGASAPGLPDEEHPEAAVEPEGTPQAESPAAKPRSDSPRLPSFLHRVRPAAEEAEPARPRALVVDAPDPAPDPS